MKKIRFLAIFLVLLMVAMPILAACDKGPATEEPGESETESSTTRTRRPIDTPPQGLPAGYASYEVFDKLALGNFSKSGNIQSVGKSGVTYTVVESDNFAEGETIARALQLYRKEGSTGETDGYINLTPNTINLADVYALEFDLMVTEKTTGSVSINGRKAGASTQFNNFLTYTASTGKLTANGQNAAELENNKWYTVTIMIFDNELYYDVYVDGWKVLGQVDYANAAYPKRSETDINLYRITMSGGATETEFYLDNLAIYRPLDETNRPMDYQGNNAVTYEPINMPAIELFNADNIVTTEDYQKLISDVVGTKVSNINGYKASESATPTTGMLDLKDAFRMVQVREDGLSYTSLAENWGDPLASAEEGYTKYLMMDGFKTGTFTEPKFNFNKDFMLANGIPHRTGEQVKAEEGANFTGSGDFYDISNYSTLEIDFFIPEESRRADSWLQFLVYIPSGNREGGISYYNVAYKTNAANFNKGFATVTIKIGTLGSTRSASLTTISGIEFRFSGWSNGVNGVAANQTDDHPIAIRSIRLTGGVKVPVQDPAEGMENCTHQTEDGTSTMTETVTVAPTCIDYGYSAWKCTVCGKTTPKTPGEGAVITEILLNPVGHRYGSADESAPDYNEREIIFPTCVKGGSSTAKCLDCGVPAVQETYAALGHEYTTKINTQDKIISFECPICGDYSEGHFSNEMPTITELKDKFTEAGVTLRGGFFGKEDLSSGADGLDNANGLTSPKINNWSILLRGSKFDVLTEGDIKFARFYNQSSGHTYGQIQSIKTSAPEDTVLEMSVRMGPMIDGKYPSFGDLWVRDNATAATEAGGQASFTFGKIEDGKIKFSNSTFAVELSETEFTHVSLVLHFSTNTIDVYVNGVMRAKDITLCGDASINAAAFIPHEFRVFQYSGAKMADSWLDAANLYTYSGSFPAYFTGVNIDGVVPEYNGPVFDYTFDGEYDVTTDETVNVEGTATVTDNALIVSGGTSVDFVVDPLKRNTVYVININLKGTENNVKNGALLTGVKGNYYGETLTESILYVDADGDIIFYNQIIGNTADDMEIAIAVNEDAKTIDVYVNGEYVVTAWYVNEDYGNVEDQVYLTGFTFNCTEGELVIDNFNVTTGKYQG